MGGEGAEKKKKKIKREKKIKKKTLQTDNTTFCQVQYWSILESYLKRTFVIFKIYH